MLRAVRVAVQRGRAQHGTNRGDVPPVARHRVPAHRARPTAARASLQPPRQEVTHITSLSLPPSTFPLNLSTFVTSLGVNLFCVLNL
jgi:hypothetical protein